MSCGLAALLAGAAFMVIQANAKPKSLADGDKILVDPLPKKALRQATLQGYAAEIEDNKTVTKIRIGYEKQRHQEETTNFTIRNDDIIIHEPTDAFLAIMKDWGVSQERIVLCIDFDWEISPGNVTQGSQIIISAGAEDRAKRAVQ
jgi:hypothetical protein